MTVCARELQRRASSRKPDVVVSEPPGAAQTVRGMPRRCGPTIWPEADAVDALVPPLGPAGDWHCYQNGQTFRALAVALSEESEGRAFRIAVGVDTAGYE